MQLNEASRDPKMSRRVDVGSGGGSPYQGLEKTTVLQEVSVYLLHLYKLYTLYLLN